MNNNINFQDDNPTSSFELISIIGKGSSSTVYKAKYKETNKILTIKVSPYNTNKDIILNEISILEQSSSNNIIDYYGYFLNEKDQTAWILLENCEYDLYKLIHQINFKLTEEEIATIIKMVLEGIIYLNSINIIHRDIKASNIFICKDGSVKLGDFGISCNKEELNPNIRVGSPYWMSPEVIKRSLYNESTDIWSLGITCIEITQGEPPYSEYKPFNAMRKIEESPPKELYKDNKYSSEFNNFVKRCLIDDHIKRPKAHQIIEDPFFKKAKGKELLRDLIIRISQYIDNMFLNEDMDKESIMSFEVLREGKNKSKSDICSVIVNSINEGSIEICGEMDWENVIRYNTNEFNEDEKDCDSEFKFSFRNKGLVKGKGKMVNEIKEVNKQYSDKKELREKILKEISILYKKRDYEINKIILNWDKRIQKLKAAKRFFDQHPHLDKIKEFKSKY